MSGVIIGMDPHKRSATTEVMTGDETVAGGGRYGTGAAGYRAMPAEAKRWPERTWAIEGCQGIGRHVANRLLAGTGRLRGRGRALVSSRETHQSRVSPPALSCAGVGVLARASTSRSWFRPATPSLG